MTKEEKKKMKKEKLKLKEKKHKKFNTFVGFILGMYLTVSAYLIYNLYRLTGVETIIRYIIMGFLGVTDLIILVKYFKMKKKTLLRKYVLFTFLLLILGGVQFFIAYTINKGLNVVDNISLKQYKTYSTSLITLKSNNLTLENIDSSTKIGRVNDSNDIENYVLTKDLMKKDKISESQIEDYDDPISLLYDLYDNKVDAVFISSSYINIYGGMEKFEKIAEETIELDKFSKKMKIKKSNSIAATKKGSDEPFTILLMGVDSTAENLSDSSGLGDSLMLITFNPQTLNATIISIPRDTYVPITCYRNVRSKITHAASGGDKCMINTIQNFFDVNIDYYAKINFRGLIKLVDALGGIDVEVPYSFCETDENRMLKNTVFVEKGYQHLNGVQALALSRNRKTYPTCGAKWNLGTRNDFVRGQNQQIVINGIINKAKSIKSVSQFYGVLDAVGGSMTTNMDKKQILSFYDVFKNVLVYSTNLTDDNSIISMQKMYLNGVGGMYHDGIMGSDLYEYIPSTNSLNAIKNAMKVNLGLKEDTINKKFSFSIDKEYEEKVIGKDKTGGVDVPLKSSTTKNTTTTNSDVSCGKNEELGADGQTCVCAHGYEKTNGVCTKQKVECDYNKELGEDGVTCVCKSDYLKSDNTCSSTKVTTSQTTTDTTTNNDDDDSNNSSTTDNNSPSTDNNTTTDTTIDPNE